MLSLLSLPLFAQVDVVAPVNEGVMRVKLKPKLSGVLSKSKIRNGNLDVGHLKLDAANKSVRAYRMERIFPYNEKHEERYRKHGLDRWYEIHFDKSIKPYDALSHYRTIEDIEIAEPSLEVKLIGSQNSSLTYTPSEIINDPYLVKQWHYNNPGEILPARKGADINLFNAWNITKGNPNVVVSIVDGGIDINHNDLKDNLWVNLAELNGTPGVDDDGNGFIDDVHGVNFIDLNGKITAHDHGTHVAGTVAAGNNNGIGVAGVAGGSGNKDGVRLMSCQVFDSKGMSGSFARAIVYGADQGAVISQNSWGYKAPDIYEQVVLDAIDYFVSEAGSYQGSPMKGGIVIFAAGNDGSSDKYYPGAYQSVVSVASMGPDFKKASYSNYGDWVDIVAPGGESGHGSAWGIFSTYPDNRYSYMDGTSMACPHVSGVAALVTSRFGSPAFTNTDLKRRLLTAAQNIEQYNPELIGKMGAGYIDALLALAENGLIAPETISDFKVEGVAQDFVELSWNAVKDTDDGNAYRYEVYYSKSPLTGASLNQAAVFRVNQINIPAGEKIQVTINNLDALTKYYYAVKAFDRWDNASSLSLVAEATTNEGPEITLPSDPVVMHADVASNSLSLADLAVKNNASGMLRWEAKFHHAGQDYAKGYSDNKNPQIKRSPVATGKVKRQKIASSDGFVRAQTSLAEQTVMRYGESGYYVIGDSEPVNDHFAATMFISDGGFNLTDVYAFLKHNNETGPIRVEIMLGNVFSKDAIIHTQEFMSDETEAYNHKMRLDRQIYIPSGKAFWINIVVPKGNRYPLGIATEYKPENSSYCFLSIDGGKTFSTLEEALRGGFNYPETAVWDVAAVSNNGYFGEFIKLSSTEGTITSNSTEIIKLQADGAKLIDGVYKSFIEFTTNDSKSRVLKHPVTFTVTGHKPKLVSEKIVNFNDVFVGANKTLDIEIVNEGLAPFNIASVTSGNPAFSRQNFISAISAQGKNIFKIRFSPKSEGSQSSVITVKGTKGETYQFTVYGIGCVEGKLAFTPEVIQAGNITADNSAKSMNVSIRNIGKYPLEYAFVNYAGQLEGELAKMAEKISANKYGYRMIHNIDNPEVNILWTDISDKGTDISSQFSIKDRAIPFQLGFDMPYYDSSYDSLYITDCGLLATHQDVPLESCMPPSANVTCWMHAGVISACGFPLKFNKSSKVYVYRTSGKAIVSYENMGVDNPQFQNGTFDFQLVLNENGNIDFIYRKVTPEVLSAMYGMLIALCDEGSDDPFVISEIDRILNTDGDKNTDDFRTEMSFRILYPGKTLVDKISEPVGILQIGEEKQVTLDLKFSGLSEGNFMQNLNILTTNPLTPLSHLKVEGTMDIVGSSSLFLYPQDTLKGLSCLRTQDLKGEIQISNRGTGPMTINQVTSSNNNLKFDPVTALTVKPKSTYLLGFTCETNATGDFSTDIKIEVDGVSHPVHVSYKIKPEPIASFSKTSFAEVLPAGQKTMLPFTISNDGEGDLRVRMEGTNLLYATGLEGADTDMSYAALQSDETSDVQYDWIDKRSESTHIELENVLGEKLNYFGVIMPFKFNFYGAEYDTLWVHKDGFVSFNKLPEDDISDMPAPRFIGVDDAYNNIIAPMWGIHVMSVLSDPQKTGIFSYKDENMVVIEWASYTDMFGISPAYDFQLILEASGSIKFQYRFSMEPKWTKYAIGLENKDASDALIISNGKDILTESVAMLIVNAPAFTVPSKAKQTVNMVVDATNFYAGNYIQKVKMQTNDPRTDVSASLDFDITLTGEGILSMADTVDMKQNIIGDEPATKLFMLENKGRAEYTVESVTPLTQQGMKLEVLEQFSNPWGTFEEYIPVEDLLPFNVNPGKAKTLRLNWITAEPSVVNEKITFTSTAGNKDVLIMGETVHPPAASVSHDNLQVIARTPEFEGDTVIVLSNKKGQSVLKYSGSIEYIRSVDKVSTAAHQTAAKSANSRTELLQTDDNTENIRSARQNNQIFERTLDHLAPDETPKNFLGFGKDLNFVAATQFTAPENGFQLSHVQTWYRSGELELSNVYAYILAGDADPGKCSVIGSGRVTVETPGGDKMGSYITVPMDEIVPLYPGESFFVKFVFPLGASNPQGHSSVLINKVVKGRYFYSDNLNWYDISLSQSFMDAVFLVKALEYKGSDEFWMTAKDKLSGEIPTGEEKAIRLSFNSKLLKQDEHSANIRILTNDPVNDTLSIPVSLSRNNAPVVKVNTADGIVRMRENESQEFVLNVTDKESDPCELMLHPESPAFIELDNRAGKYYLIANPDFDCQGVHVINITARDNWGAESVNPLRIEIENVNRAPLAQPMADLDLGTDEFSSEINLNDYFTDPDKEVLKYEFINDNPEFVRVFLSGNTLLFKGLMKGKAIVRIQAMDPLMETVQQTMIVNVTSPTGIDKTEANDIIVTPNPVITKVMIDWSESFSEEVGYNVYTAAGVRLMNGSLLKQSELDMTQLSAGIYYLVLSSENKTKTIKLIKK